MALTTEQIQTIETVLKNALRQKFQTYKPETDNMPFHTRLLGKDRMALFSFNGSKCKGKYNNCNTLQSYEPKPYSPWTMAGMLDLENELKVSDEFWDFLGGQGTYKDLLDCFERVGIELRKEIEECFKKFS